MKTRYPVGEAATRFLAAPQEMLIGADWVDAADGKQLEVRNPADGEVFAREPAGGAADIDRAVRAAHAAFDMFTETKSVMLAV
ncbi:MAG: aldehyde dehydrogenase family protein [Burkholderiales bacterium]|nr:aldehyde dehydrogenase family protein [Burkholderiales bacterium]